MSKQKNNNWRNTSVKLMVENARHRLSQALQVSFNYPLSMRGLREFFKSYVHTRVHYVRVDSDSQYPKMSVLLI